ncbi:hypothetical protein KY363_04820 [Candidatus Woesearchaeota archaeon]|nr:hypothetical protein [Candidatus Woesearchaeota archaeon]
MDLIPDENTQEAPEIISLKEECIGFIEDEMHQGYGLDQIRKDLIDEGFPQDIIEFSADFVQKHNKVSNRDKVKQVSKDQEQHVKRRFHLPVIAVAGLIAALILLFFITGVGKEEQKEAPEKIDIFLYNNLGITPGSQKIAGSEQIYSRDEVVTASIAQAALDKHSSNAILSQLKLSDTVQGFKKRATVFNVIGGGMQKKTLVEIRFQPTKDVSSLKIVESVPKSTATSEEITLTQGGVIAEKDPVIVFTFNNLKADKAQTAVYVIDKELSTLDTMTFAAEDRKQSAAPAETVYCGDGKCVQGESYMTCCDDCGCPTGSVCERGSCTKAEKDQCQENTDCEDSDASTKDLCAGVPKTCSNEKITSCESGDNYCPSGCAYDVDFDCPQTETAATTTESSTAENQTTEANTTTGNETASGNQSQNITLEQESPKISNVTVTPQNLTIGSTMKISAIVTDANGQDDIEQVWWEVLELAQTHGEKGDMTASGTLYTATQTIGEHYLTGWYHMRVYAKDTAGNQKREGTTFQVVGNSTS